MATPGRVLLKEKKQQNKKQPNENHRCARLVLFFKEQHIIALC